MRLGIDGSNIRSGGGVTHLMELIRAAEPAAEGFDRVILWSGDGTLQRIPDRPWLQKVCDPLLNRALPARLYWQMARLSQLARRECDVLFIPGGNYIGSFRPFVAMSQNLLPFELREALRFGVSATLLRLLLLRLGQSRTFSVANGLVFLSEFARSRIEPRISARANRHVVIPHGVDSRFFLKPRPQRPIGDYGVARPFRLSYVSIVTVYKHQWNVAAAVSSLRREGVPVRIDFVGPAVPRSERQLTEAIRALDPAGEFLSYKGPVAFHELHSIYHESDAFVFASSCENLPNIMLEAMAAGLPIAASNRGPMPETLGDSGLYFDPEQPTDIRSCLSTLLANHELRYKLASGAYEKAKTYSWERCAKETFQFLAEIGGESMSTKGQA